MMYTWREVFTRGRHVQWLYLNHRGQRWPTRTLRYWLIQGGFEAVQRFILRHRVTAALVPPAAGSRLMFAALRISRLLGGVSRPPRGLGDPARAGQSSEDKKA